MKTVNIIFNCSPSLAIIDSWMPILSLLRERLPSANFVFVVPKNSTLMEIDKSSWLHQECEKVFDEIILKDDSGHWYKSSSFHDAIWLAKKIRSWRVVKLFRKIGFYGIGTFVSLFQSWLSSRIFQASLCNFYIKAYEPGVMLFDLLEIDKHYADYIERNFSEMKKYSLLHGPNVLGVRHQSADANSPSPLSAPSKVRALLFSELEKEFYKKKYELDDRNLYTVGIPRHEAQWVDKLISAETGACLEKYKPFILVIGRPSNKCYHPKERKIKSLQEIRKIAKKYSLNIVVKTHPKEHGDGTYEKVLSGMPEGLTWGFTNAHQLKLVKNCVFVVTFFSSIAVDAIRLGVPVVERLDLRGLPFADNNASLRDANKEPVFVFRYLGFALGATDWISLEDQVSRVMEHTADVTAEQRNAYDGVYPTIPDINERISRMIASDLSSETVGDCLER